MDANVIGNNIKLETLRDFCNKNHNSTEDLFTLCRQINEIEELIGGGLRKITYGKIISLRPNILLTALGENLGCYIDKPIRNWRVYLSDHNSKKVIEPIKL